MARNQARERGGEGNEALAALNDPVRRRLYEYVSAQREPVGRDQAAAAAGIGRPLAAFHLDRLERAGLLQASYRRVSGRAGPGAGRPAKLYERSGREFTPSFPPRDYLRAARLLVEAVVGTASAGVKDAVTSAARSLGLSIARTSGQPERTDGSPRDGLLSILDEQGYQPFVDEEGVIRMRNCPFDTLASSQPDLICSMNLGLIEGVLDGMGGTGVEATIDRHPGCCCVALKSS
ncbi:MAG TPA: transcriptional regulator [Candidatus Dormibacteraeota bacterium]